MALSQTSFYSSCLGMQTQMNVILPEYCQGIGLSVKENLPEEIPVLYLLHGLSDDHSIWLRRTSIERYVARRPLAVVMPYGGKSFYCNTLQQENYWDFLSQELPHLIQSFFHLKPRRENSFVAGLSMGGYGALKLALKRPESFCAAASFSGALDLVEIMEQQFLPNNPLSAIFQNTEDIISSGNHLPTLLQPQPTHPKPRLYLNCGTEDILLQSNRQFVDLAKTAGYDIQYTETIGEGHTWELWDSQIQKALDWMGL